jgi:hypothetical protein
MTAVPEPLPRRDAPASARIAATVAALLVSVGDAAWDALFDPARCCWGFSAVVTVAGWFWR